MKDVQGPFFAQFSAPRDRHATSLQFMLAAGAPHGHARSPLMPRDVRFFESGLRLIKGDGDLKTALGQLLQLAAESGNCVSASFYIADWNEKVLTPLVTYGLPSTYVEACGNVMIGDQCCGRAVEQGKPWIVSDMLTDPLFASAKAAASVSPIRAAFSVPVIDTQGKIL